MKQTQKEKDMNQDTQIASAEELAIVRDFDFTSLEVEITDAEVEAEFGIQDVVVEEIIVEDDVDLVMAEIEAVEAVEIDESAIMDEVDAAIARHENYQEQTAAAVATTDPAVVATSATPRKSKRTAGPAKPRAETDLSLLPGELFVLEGDVTAMDQAALDAAKATTIAAKPAQVKVAEKFDNLLVALNAGRKPSRYTEIALDLLIANTAITSSDLVAAYRSSGLGDGTARSQSGQMMALFPALGIAVRTAKSITLNAESNIVTRYKAI
jgi:hypothetical protein